MKLFMFVFMVLNDNNLIYGSFMKSYIDPAIVSSCGDIQKKLIVKHAIRVQQKYNINSHVVYLITENQVYAVPQLTAALFPQEPTKEVLRELVFNRVTVTSLDEFWNKLKPQNENYNTVFADWHTFNTVFWLFGDKYREVNISVNQFKFKSISDPKEFSKSEFGFMHNQKIREIGFQHIFAVDFAFHKSRTASFQPIRVYVRDIANDGNAISFAFHNQTEVEEEFEDGKHYSYSFDAAAHLGPGRSYRNGEYKNHYFEVRTRSGTFSLFDFDYNTDNLMNGATEELLGCPPSFCQTHRFDDIIRLHSGKKSLVYREWVWNFTKPGDKLVYEEAVIANISSRDHSLANFGKPFEFAIRHIVDGSFTHNGILYIFRNGSFIQSVDDLIIQKRIPFNNYTEMGSFFKGVPTQFYDALFYHKESKIVHFILDDKYWAYSMDSRKLVSDEYPKHIKALGLPHNIRIKATFVDEDELGNQTKFYFFTDANYIYYNASQFKNAKFESQELIYYCTSTTFLGCPQNNHFHCPPEPIDESTNSSTIIFISFGIIVILIWMIAMILLLITLSKKGKQNMKKDVPQKIDSKSKKLDVKLPSITDANPSSLSMRSVATDESSSKKTKK